METAEFEQVRITFEKWNETQAYLKKAELITEAAPIAAINELRYAGRVFSSAALMARDLPDTFDLKILQSGKGKTFSQSITITKQYLDNANHDISDTLVYFYNAALNSLSERYGKSLLYKKFPDIIVAYEKLDTAKKLIIESRGNISVREKNYILVRELMDEMENIYPSIRDADIMQEIAVQKEERKKKRFVALALASGLVIGFFSAVLIF